MEFEDRSDRKIPATLMVMSEIHMAASQIPEPGEMNELVNKIAEMVGSLRNAKGVCWHVQNVETASFPPGEMNKPFEMLIKMHNIVGTTAIWAATMAQIFPPLGELKDMAVGMADTANRLLGYIKDITTARAKSESLSRHCEECTSCRQFFDRFEDEAKRFIQKQEDNGDVREKVMEVLSRPPEGGCN